MVIYLAIVFIFVGIISIISLCRAAGRADNIEDEILNQRENL
jgi:hypothetical protein